MVLRHPLEGSASAARTDLVIWAWLLPVQPQHLLPGLRLRRQQQLPLVLLPPLVLVVELAASVVAEESWASGDARSRWDRLPG